MILVSGANGFVGKALCRNLLARGHSVRGAVRSMESVMETLEVGLKYAVVGDIGAETDWSDALLGIDCVIHCAARAHVMNEPESDAIEAFRAVNAAGTRRLAEQAANAGVRRFVYLSSIKVNGEHTNPGSSSRAKGRATSDRVITVFREDDVPNPQDAYAISKWEAEQRLATLARETDMEVTIIRPPLVYGPGVKGNFAALLRWIEKGIPLPLGAVRNNRRSLVGLDNLVDSIVTCIDHPAAANQVFLVSDGEDLSTSELLRRTSLAVGKPARLIPIPQGFLEFGLKMLGKQDMARRLCGSLQVDIGKARDLLGWTPMVSVDDGLRRVAGWYRDI